MLELNSDYFSFKKDAETISIYNTDEELPNPIFYVVLANIIDDVVLWTQFKVTLQVLPPFELKNTAPTFTSPLTEIFVVD